MSKYVLVEENNSISKTEISDVVTSDSIIDATTNLTPSQQSDIRQNIDAVGTFQGWLDEPRIKCGSYDYAAVILAANYDEQDVPFISFAGNNYGEKVLLTNVRDPKTESDAATKDYVDGKILIVNITFTYPNSYSADKTFAQITNAYNNGAIIVCTDGYNRYYMTFLNSDYTAIFCNCTYDPEEGYCPSIESYVVVSSEGNDTWSRNMANFPLVTNEVYSLASSITLDTTNNNTVYEYRTLSSLTLTSIDTYGSFKIHFTSGSTPTVVSFPNTMKFQQAFVPAANTRYEIQVDKGYAIVYSWPTS